MIFFPIGSKKIVDDEGSNGGSYKEVKEVET